jgi:hypothetical protein
LLIGGQAQGQKKIKGPPIINLNNNGSLYTFQNPNAQFPSQLKYAFTAVAHEDCRLYNNGATLMPIHRLMAAECQAAIKIEVTAGAPPVPPTPVTPPIICVLLPNGQLVCTAGGVGGINYNRSNPYPNPSYALYSNGNSNYGQYTPSSQPATSSSSMSTPGGSAYGGFGLRNWRPMGGFATMTEVAGTFGDGFDRDSDASKPESENSSKN